MKGLLIKTDGTESEVKFGWKVFDEIQDLIRTNVLDSVNLRDGRVMWLDDTGQNKRLDINEKATKLYHDVCKPGTTYEIVGDVVILNDSDFGGE